MGRGEFNTPKSKIEIMNQVLWYNSHIRVLNKMICFDSWLNKGIYTIKDIAPSGSFFTFSELKEIYGAEINVMQYNQLLSAIPKKWKKEIANAPEDEHYCLYTELCERTKWSQIVYRKLICANVELNKIKDIWVKIYPDFDTQEAERLVRNINKNIMIPKYQAFSYRLIYGAIYLNNHLVHYGIVENNLCDNCKVYKETVQHFFLECTKAVKIWNEVREYLRTTYHVCLTNNKRKLFFNRADDSPHNS